MREEEADWLGPALLVSEEAALYIVGPRISLSQAVSVYGVSKDAVAMRIGVTGARGRGERRAVC